MDIKTIKEIMQEFKSCGLTKLEIKHDDIDIKMEKKTDVIMGQAPSQDVPVVLEVGTQLPSCSTVVSETASIKEVPAAPPVSATGCAIMSPMVGTAYTAPGPDTERFVSLGQKVKKGDVVCIIEAMKLMNEVEAEISGEIIEILIKNEDMVEFGQPLFIIEPEA